MTALTGHTRPLAVLGHPIGHTLSPAMHNAAIEALRLDAVYLAFDVAPEALASVLAAMRAMGFLGVNLTVPHKEAAIPALDALDETAQLLGAVNTVHFTEAGLKGFNTDGYGFLKAYEEAFGNAVTNRSLFVLGTGGAGRAVALVSARAGVSAVTLADTDEARMAAVAAAIREHNPDLPVEQVVDPARQIAAAREADTVIHATPVGMKEGDPALLPPEAFRAGQQVFDLVYNRPETPVTASARAGGAAASNGLGMLLHQGAKAFAIWLGHEPPVETMRTVLEQAVYGA